MCLIVLLLQPSLLLSLPSSLSVVQLWVWDWWQRCISSAMEFESFLVNQSAAISGLLKPVFHLQLEYVHFKTDITSASLLAMFRRKLKTSISAVIGPSRHTCSQDFVWGAFFLPKKLTTFFSRRPQRPSKYTSKSSPPSKNCPKIDSCSGWGCTSCPGGALTHFPCKLRLNFFHALGVQVHPLHPLAMPIMYPSALLRSLFVVVLAVVVPAVIFLRPP